MDNKPYTKEDFKKDLQNYASNFKDDKINFNVLFNTNIVFLQYKASTKEMKPAIVCSFKPLVKLFLTGLKYKKSDIRVILNKLNTKTKNLSNKSKIISTYNLNFREVVSLPLENIKISYKIELNWDNIEQIIKTLKGISKMWDIENPMKRRFA